MDYFRHVRCGSSSLLSAQVCAMQTLSHLQVLEPDRKLTFFAFLQKIASNVYLCFVSLVLCMWTSVESWSYVYSNKSMKWDDARNWCKENYTDMVAIQNREEIEHLNNWLPKKKGYYWIGIVR